MISSYASIKGKRCHVCVCGKVVTVYTDWYQNKSYLHVQFKFKMSHSLNFHACSYMCNDDI